MHRNNIIQKQILKVDMSVPGLSPFAAQMQTTTWCNDLLIPAISRKLEKYSLVDDVVRLEQIRVDIADEIELLTTELADRIAREIDSIIQQKIESASIHEGKLVVAKSNTVIEAFIFFLCNGYFPWWMQRGSIAEFEDVALLELSEENKNVLSKILVDPIIRKRFVTALSPVTIAGIISAIADRNEKDVKSWLEKIRELSALIDTRELQTQFVIWSTQQIILALLKNADETSIIKTLVQQLMQYYKINAGALRLHFQLHQIIHEKDFEQIIIWVQNEFNPRMAIDKDQLSSEKIISDELIEAARERLLFQQRTLQQKEGIYINNSGLILLAPFLPRFFETLGIIENGQFNSKDLALAMLNWLVNGNDQYEESELVLAKILCGMEPEEAIIIIPFIPESFKKEGDDLLQSVIAHWTVLKNTSLNGLRESFLQRKGKLSRYPEEWYLQVEQKPYDMLLQHLPWNISLVRLSWMQWILKTEWVV